MNVRTLAAIYAGKAAGAASRLLGRGGGTAIAGVVAERVEPRIVARLAAQAGAGAIAVTGTNGKTTTSLMLNRIASAAGLSPLHNRSGSNLMRGVAAMLVEEASLAGGIPDGARRLAILEVDEATLPQIVRAVTPRAIVFTNLFRDQLDRYGEVDTVAASWRQALGGLTPRGQVTGYRGQVAGYLGDGDRAAGSPTLVLNADDPAVADLGRDATAPVLYYGLDDVSAAVEAREHASDFRSCLRCGAELAYTATFYGHIGHWRCPACGNARPAPDVRVTAGVAAGDEQTLSIALPDGELHLTLPLAGLYNAYNALAAVAGAVALGLPHAAVVRALAGFSAAFGRQERFRVRGRDVQVLLGKNPTGINQVLRTIAAKPGEKRVVFFLNDGIADGRDISWIWDADYEALQPQAAYVLAAGTRAEDLALRLKYAGYGDAVPVVHSAKDAVSRAIDATPEGATLFVVPTYTAMLEVRELLAQQGGAKRFWEDA
jgi:UDP-N-acetylmuramyl tripeptide synthase